MRSALLRLVVAIGVALAATVPSAARQDATTITAAEFFSSTRIWRAHLTMSAESWTAMQPRAGGGADLGGGAGGRFLGPPGGRNGVAARRGIEFDYVHATLQIDDWTFRDVAVRYKGNGSSSPAARASSVRHQPGRGRLNTARTKRPLSPPLLTAPARF